MAVTAFIRKALPGEEKAENRSNKRRKVNNGSSAALGDGFRPTIKPKVKKSTNEPQSNASLFKRKAKSTQPSAESLASIYYFKAPQERNSVEELGVWEQPDAEPDELRALLEEKALGMSDEDLMEEREDRLRERQRFDEVRFERRCMLYGEEAARAYVTPGWSSFVPTVGQEKLLRGVAAMKR